MSGEPHPALWARPHSLGQGESRWPYCTPEACAMCALRLLRSTRSQFEHTLFGDIGERFGVACPSEHCTQGRLRLLGPHVVFELFAKTAERCTMIGASVQYLTNVRRQRNVRDQVVCEQILAFVDAGIGEAPPHFGQRYVAFGKIDETQKLQDFGNGQQLVGLEL